MPRKEHGWGTRKGEVELAGKWNCRAGKRKKQENARVCAVVLQFQRLIHTNAHLWKERERERERERELGPGGLQFRVREIHEGSCTGLSAGRGGGEQNTQEWNGIE